MIKHVLAPGGLTLAIGLIAGTATAQQQSQPAPKPAAQPAAPKAPAKATTGKAWTPPKTPWGEPDLQGIWPLNHLIATPFQRPEKYGDRRFLTEEEYAAAVKAADSRNKRFESGAIPQADSG